MKKINLLFILSFVSLTLLIGCSEDDTSNGETPDNAETIADFVASNAEFSLLNEAIIRVGLNTSLDGTDNYTLFALNNTAFQDYLTAEEYSSVSQMPIEVLNSLMLNHLAAGNVPTSDLQGYRNSFSEVEDNKLTLFTTNSNGVLINGNASISTPNITRSNGVIHVLNQTIDFLNVTDMSQTSTDFTLFAELLEAASDDNVNYTALLSSEEFTYTIFAPSNQAFQDLFAFMGVSGISEIPQKVLGDILDHHIVTGDNFQDGDFVQDQILTTRSGEDITVSLENGISFSDATSTPTGIVTPNIQTTNGVMHNVDRVLWSQRVLETIDPTITRWIEVDTDFSILETALEVTGLDVVLDDRETEYTILAPNNAAFLTYLDGEDVDDVPVDILTNLLLNHILTGNVASGDLSTGYITTQATYNETDNNIGMYVDTSSGVQFNGTASVSQADVSVSNGRIHVVDGVLTLPTLATFANADTNLSSLLTALTRDDQPDYISTLNTEMDSGDTPYTFWAPGNGAFDDLLVELGLNDISEINSVTLTGALNTHIVALQNLRAEDLESGPLATLGDEITVDAVTGTLTDLNDRTATIITTNIQAANGVMHSIDKVLLPQ